MALLATSPGAPTLRADASGEIAVAPDRPGQVQVRFTVADPAPNLITRLQVFALVYGDSDPRVSATTTATVVGSQNQVAGLGYLDLDPTACARGCEVVTDVVASWLGQTAPGVRTRWEAEIEVQYESGPPEKSAVSAAIVSGGGPAVPRMGWLLIGAVLAVAAGFFLAATGDRLGRARLLLAAGLVVPPAIWLALLAASLSDAPPGVTVVIDVDTYVAIGAAIGLILATAAGAWRAWRGRDAVLRVAGWLGALAVGLMWWQTAVHLATYRPSEMVLLTFAFALPCAAAIGGVPSPAGAADQTGAPATAERRIGAVMALVIAAQVLMAVVSVFVAGALVFAFVAGLLMPGGRGPDLGSVLFGLVPILVAVGFGVGLYSWRRGFRGTLVAANVPVVLVVLGAAAWSLVAGEDGLLVPTPELRVMAVLAAVLALIGVFGAWLIRPSWAAGEG